MTRIRLVALTLLALLAFAANSILCRLAFERTDIDAASFTAIRLAAGALMLWLLVLRRPVARIGGDWPSAVALFAYAAAFSFAYVALETGVGALLLFGAVQMTMLAAGLRTGERLDARQSVGLALALGGLAYLLWPGLAAPPLGSALLMLAAGFAWGVYSLRGRGSRDPLAATAGNFLRAAPLGLGLALLALPGLAPDPAGAGYAVLSGALASGAGYAVWYAALRGLAATHAATVQLSVPLIAAAGGIALLDEPLTWRFAFAAVAILGGIALGMVRRRERSGAL